MLRVLSVCETIKGGIATYLTMFGHLDGDKFSHTIIVPAHHREELPGDWPVVTFEGATRGVRKVWRLYKVATHVARDLAPDIIFFHSTFTLPVMALMRGRFPQARFIYCPHGWAFAMFYERPFLQKIVSIVEGTLSGFSDAVINISSADCEHAKSRGYRGRQLLIENAVTDLKFWKFDPAARVCDEGHLVNVLFVGRLDKQKGFDILIEAFEKASSANPNLRLHVVGERVLATDSGHSKDYQNVTFHGWKNAEELEILYSACDIVAIPSRWEGFGLVAAEALRSGTPLLVSDKGALPGFVTTDVTGYVAELTVDAFAQALSRLNRDKLHHMRAACRSAYTEKYHVDRFLKEFVELFENLSPKAIQS